MTVYPAGQRRWLAVGALVLACALGFALARFTTGSPVPTPPETQAAPLQTASRTALELSASYLKTVGIEVESVTSGSLAEEIRAPAAVSGAPDGQAVVTARAAGTVVRIHKRLGDPVRAGETLALVESREAAAITAARAVADARLALARSVMEREKGLFEQHVTPRQDFETAQAQLIAAEAEARSARLAAANAHVSKDGHAVQVTSPLAGRITSATAALGMFVQADSELFRAADPTRIQIEAAVSASDAARISPGDRATITSASGAMHAATVVSVTPTVNEQTRSATVVLSVADPGAGQAGKDAPARGLPAPGELARAVITPKSASSAGFVVSEEAIQRIDGRDTVFVRTAKGFRVQPVVVAARSGGRAAILAGLTAGQSIATRNAFLLKAELGKGTEDEE